MMRHLVHRQIFELRFADEAAAQHWSQQLADLNQRTILPELERTFSQLVDNRQYLQIERLEVDLGSIPQRFLDSDLTDLLREKLSEALQPYLDMATAAGPELSAQPQSSALASLSAASLSELFTLYLQTGRLPWWLDNELAGRLDNLYRQFWQTAPQQARALVLATLVEPLPRRRLIEQFSNLSHQLILQQLLPDSLASLLGELRKLAAKLLSRLQGVAHARSDSFEVVYQLLAKTEKPSDGQLIRLVRQLFVDLAAWSGVPYAQLMTAIDPEVSRSNYALPTRILLAKLLRDDARLADPRGRPAQTRHAASAVSDDAEDLEPPAVRSAVGLEIPLDNAGLVLLWPYLPELFRKLGLLKTTADQTQRPKLAAVLLLQQLVTGQAAAPEHQLALNKLLCGVALQTPVARRLRRSQTWDAEIEGLLMAVINHWSVLKGTSIFGLRSSFLQRDGLLIDTEQGWLLRVERKVYDLLLEQLPWGIGMIQLSWMDKPLRVEW